MLEGQASICLHCFLILFLPLLWKAVKPLRPAVPLMTSRVCWKHTIVSALQFYFTVKNLSGNTSFCTTIHLLTFYPLMGGIGGIRQRHGTPWPVNSSLQGYHTDTNNYSHLRLIVRVINRPAPEMPDFELWEETGHLERTSADTERMWKLNRERLRASGIRTREFLAERWVWAFFEL